MVDAGFVAVLSFALYAGVVTFFSPCAFALLPGYVGFYVSQTGGDASLGGALTRGAAAAVGAVGTLAALLGVAYWLGNRAVAGLFVLEPAVGLLLVAFGALVVVGRAPSISVPLPERRAGVFGFGVFGAGYAVASAGCVAPIFGAVIAQALDRSAGEASVVLGTYAGAIALLMLSLTVAAGMGVLANAGRIAAYSRRLEQLAGALMIVAGLGQLYVAMTVSSSL